MLITTLCYLFKEDEVLMLYRNKKENDFHEGKWNGLGGKVELNEPPIEGAIREIKEESGLIVKEIELMGECFFPNFQGDMVDEMMYLYRCDHFEGKLIECAEGDLHWIKVKDLLSLNIWESDKIFLPYVIENRKFKGIFEFNGTILQRYQIELIDT